MAATLVPLGAQVPAPTYTVTIDPSSFHYDVDRQLNVTPDGGLWAMEPIAASSTATNNDSNGPADETKDPYLFEEPDPGQAPAAHGLMKAAR
ncbi:hypothetical protein ACFTZ8_05220 [Streptomyces fungicidicus]|uniref:hypothetical protein n=1 Tax=Streptomyces fungicidicus TaxID=68203 RepID=UPI00340B1566